MTSLSIRQFCAVLVTALSVLGPFFAAFYRELRFSPRRTAGILCGVLFFAFILSVFAAHFLPERLSWRPSLLSCFLMPFHIGLCMLLSRMSRTVILYTLFMFQNFMDTAFLCGVLLRDFLWSQKIILPGGSDLLPFTAVLFLCPLAYHFISPYLLNAVEYTRTLSSWRSLASIPFLFFIIFRCIVYDIATRTLPFDAGSYFRYLFWIAAVCLVHYVILHALYSLSQNFSLKEQYKTTRLLADLQTSQMARLQKALDQAAQSRHNMRFQLTALKGFLEQKKVQKALSYINDCLGSIQSATGSQYCQNLPANSLLDYYLDEARRNSIQVSAHVSLPTILPMPDVDFCTILGNLLSNALEACLRQEGGSPAITVNIRQAGDSMITMSVTNSYSHEIRRQNGVFLSSKGDRPGIGTASVRVLVERYHGVLNFKYENGIFVASLLLNPSMGEGS